MSEDTEMRRFYITHNNILLIKWCDDFAFRCPAYIPEGLDINGHKCGVCGILQRSLVFKYGDQSVPEDCPLEIEQ